MPYPYEQLSRRERDHIAMRRRQGVSRRAVGRELGRAASTIGRELRRNGQEDRGYFSRRADERAQERRHRPRRRPKMTGWELRGQVEGALKSYWSPEQISGRGSLLGWEPVSRTTIYRHIQQDEAKYQPYLRGPIPRRNRGRYQRIRGQQLIDERPAEVERRERVGDWESDTLRGPIATEGCLVTHVERRTRYLVVRRMKDRQARELNRQTIQAMKGLPVHTLTVDHGMEFGCFGELEAHLGAKVYFAHKRCPWERGLNENTNRLLRQFFPRGMDLTLLSPADVRRAEELLNNRPRKCLGYRTPKETMSSLGVALVT